MTSNTTPATPSAPAEDDRDPVALLFPGQGSQAPGMGHLLWEHSQAARETYEEASDYSGINLTKVCFEADADDLADTVNTQPAVLTTSVAFLRAMREKLTTVGESVRPRLLGGHSLGLFSAAVASEALSFRDAVFLILERARLMGSFNDDRPVGMASVIGLDEETIRQICEDVTHSVDDRVDVANYNLDTQTVISGDVTALERAMDARPRAAGEGDSPQGEGVQPHAAARRPGGGVREGDPRGPAGRSRARRSSRTSRRASSRPPTRSAPSSRRSCARPYAGATT